MLVYGGLGGGGRTDVLGDLWELCCLNTSAYAHQYAHETSDAATATATATVSGSGGGTSSDSVALVNVSWAWSLLQASPDADTGSSISATSRSAPIARFGHAATEVRAGVMVVVGGSSVYPRTLLDDAYEYDRRYNIWTPLTAIGGGSEGSSSPFGRLYHTLVALHTSSHLASLHTASTGESESKSESKSESEKGGSTPVLVLASGGAQT